MNELFGNRAFILDPPVLWGLGWDFNLGVVLLVQKKCVITLDIVHRLVLQQQHILGT
jgi:hypothetical protein